MRIKQINVVNLFGLFNHKIPFNLEEKVTIIHGPNGFGKTIILKFIDGLFNGKYNIFFNIPFKEFEIEFENGEKITLIKDESSDINEITLRFQKDGHIINKPFRFIDLKKLGLPTSMLEDLLPLHRVDLDSWIWIPTDEKLTLGEIISRYGDVVLPRLPPSVRKELKLEEHKELTEYSKNLPIHLIETQRLLKISDEKIQRHSSRRRISPLISVVKEYSNELTINIESLLARFGELSQSLDRTFPVRLMKTRLSEHLTKEELQEELNQLEKKRQQLRDLGLLEKADEDIQIQEIDDDSKKVLSVYIKDVEDKLSIFDDMAKKIDLLKNIINDHFLYKELLIDKQKGFIFKNENDQIIETSDLSSGEQHELVLLYQLLFKVKSNSLILIDEPEISLHVAWQKEFLNDIQSISKIKNFDILIATHSPQIINERWDMTVKLKGIKNGRSN
ncbi:MAG: AAA family ATPase [Candidatus Hermodarchaeota archaeon]